ncbi:hypothetical protein [Lysobacter gummosus]|uniref:hypothetical protein n=1 Tax=Lysobacter gummosus TaxID=262324 RepID=UPI003635CDE9
MVKEAVCPPAASTRARHSRFKAFFGATLQCSAFVYIFQRRAAQVHVSLNCNC